MLAGPKHLHPLLTSAFASLPPGPFDYSNLNDQYRDFSALALRQPTEASSFRVEGLFSAWW